jgi:phage terminase Nu1 subunit (DNA packaging protein)
VELAGLVDRDPGTVSRWMKREDWPFPRQFPLGRSLVPKILRWVADTLLARDLNRESDAPDDPKKDLRQEKLRQEIRKLHAQADTAETALAKERGQLIDAGEVETQWARIGVIVRNAFQNVPAQLLPLALTNGMPHQAAPVFMEQTEQIITSILRHLSTSDPSEDDSAGAAQVP